MGGAAGHLMHLYDDRSLKFVDLKAILASAAEGRLERVTEKFDGLNLVFTWNVDDGTLRVARSTGDIKRGGMTPAELSVKFAGRGNLSIAFDSAVDILSKAIESLPPKVLVSSFGEAGDRWYSVEVIYTQNPNVINYDVNTIVFHGSPVFHLGQDGRVGTADEASTIALLTDRITTMQAAVANRGWKIMGPALTRLNALCGGSVLVEATTAIDELLRGSELSDEATIQDYIEARMQDDVGQLRLPPPVSRMVVLRASEAIGAPTLVDIRKKADKSRHETITTFIKTSPARVQGFMRPLEGIVNRFAAAVLRGVSSVLVSDPRNEVERINSAVAGVIEAIEATKDQTAVDALHTQLDRLRSTGTAAAIEGVVFLYRGTAYKLTGTFASINQILGLYRYDGLGR
jgi:hypothetical protein